MNNTKNTALVVALVALLASNAYHLLKSNPSPVAMLPVTSQRVAAPAPTPAVLGETKAVLPPRSVSVVNGVKTETISTASFIQEMEVSIDKTLENNEYDFTLSGIDADITDKKLTVTTSLDTGSPIAGKPVVTLTIGTKNAKDFVLLKSATIDANLVAYDMIKKETTKAPKALFTILQNNRPNEPIKTIALENDKMILTFEK